MEALTPTPTPIPPADLHFDQITNTIAQLANDQAAAWAAPETGPLFVALSAILIGCFVLQLVKVLVQWRDS